MYMSALVEKDVRQIHDLSTMVSRNILARELKFVQHQPPTATHVPPAFIRTLSFGGSFFYFRKIMGRIVTEHHNTD